MNKNHKTCTIILLVSLLLGSSGCLQDVTPIDEVNTTSYEINTTSTMANTTETPDLMSQRDQSAANISTAINDSDSGTNISGSDNETTMVTRPCSNVLILLNTPFTLAELFPQQSILLTLIQRDGDECEYRILTFDGRAYEASGDDIMKIIPASRLSKDIPDIDYGGVDGVIIISQEKINHTIEIPVKSCYVGFDVLKAAPHYSTTIDLSSSNIANKLIEWRRSSDEYIAYEPPRDIGTGRYALFIIDTCENMEDDLGYAVNLYISIINDRRYDYGHDFKVFATEGSGINPNYEDRSDPRLVDDIRNITCCYPSSWMPTVLDTDVDFTIFISNGKHVYHQNQTMVDSYYVHISDSTNSTTWSELYAINQSYYDQTVFTNGTQPYMIVDGIFEWLKEIS